MGLRAMDLAQALAYRAVTFNDTNPTPSPTSFPDPLVNMPPHIADIYVKLLYVLAGLWLLGTIKTFWFACKKWDTCTGNEGARTLTLRASLHGVSNVPVPVRFYRNQGDRWVNVCSFGLTVSALANLVATLLFGQTDLGNSDSLFYFYSYFVIFIIFALIYWPMFISRNQAHRFNGRLYGLIYSGCMFATVILSSVFNTQELSYTLVLNMPYMVCSLLIFCYFCYAFYKFRPVKRPAGDTEAPVEGDMEDSGVFYVRNIDGKTMALNANYFDVEHSYVSGLLMGPRKVQQKARALLARQEAEAELNKKVRWFVLKWRAFKLWFAKPTTVRLGTRLLAGVTMALQIAYTLSVVFCFWVRV